MKNMKIKIDEVLINTLLDGCFKSGKVEIANKIFNYIKKLNIATSNIT